MITIPIYVCIYIYIYIYICKRHTRRGASVGDATRQEKEMGAMLLTVEAPE